MGEGGVEDVGPVTVAVHPCIYHPCRGGLSGGDIFAHGMVVKIQFIRNREAAASVGTGMGKIINDLYGTNVCSLLQGAETGQGIQAFLQSFLVGQLQNFPLSGSENGTFRLSGIFGTDFPLVAAPITESIGIVRIGMSKGRNVILRVGKTAIANVGGVTLVGTGGGGDFGHIGMSMDLKIDHILCGLFIFVDDHKVVGSGGKGTADTLNEESFRGFVYFADTENIAVQINHGAQQAFFFCQADQGNFCLLDQREFIDIQDVRLGQRAIYRISALDQIGSFGIVVGFRLIKFVIAHIIKYSLPQLIGIIQFKDRSRIRFRL